MLIRNLATLILIVSVLLIVSCSQSTQEISISPTKSFLPIADTASPTITPSPIPTSTPTHTYTPLPSNTPTRTPKPTPLEVVKVMQYNVLFGGRFTEICDRRSSFGNTFDSIIYIIQQADPDILVVNEACDWDILAPKITKQLNMSDYFVGTDFIDGSAPIALFTKYEILDTESLKYDEEIRMETLFKGIRARIVTSSNQELQIFGFHFTPQSGDEGNIAKRNQSEWVAKLIEEYPRDNVILVGDLNATYDFYYSTFNPIGLTGLFHGGVHYRWTGESWLPIDQIWISPSLKFQPWSQNMDYYENLKSTIQLWESASDHNPEAVVIGIYPP